MRAVARPERLPDGFTDPSERELAAATGYFGPPRQSPKAFEFSVYKRAEVKIALDRLFHGKCAYCETRYADAAPMDVEHFRPKGGVEGEADHPGYWWLAMRWDNLLPSCLDCNRRRLHRVLPFGAEPWQLEADAVEAAILHPASSGKKDAFPLAQGGIRARAAGDALDAERALLLNPCVDDPSDYLAWHFGGAEPISFVLPRIVADEEEEEDYFLDGDRLSLRASTSIRVYGLNRLELIQSRTELLRRLEFLGALVVDLRGFADELGDGRAIPDEATRGRTQRTLLGFADRVVGELRRMGEPRQPFSSMVQAWIEAFAARVAQGGSA